MGRFSGVGAALMAGARDRSGLAWEIAARTAHVKQANSAANKSVAWSKENAPDNLSGAFLRCPMRSSGRFGFGFGVVNRAIRKLFFAVSHRGFGFIVFYRFR